MRYSLNILGFWLLLLSHSFNNKASGQRFNNWYFPILNGVTFNTAPPSILAGSPMGFPLEFSCGTISNNIGQLLFSSNAVRVWDRNNNQMPNGFGLLGGLNLINGVLILPVPSSSEKYYLFTAQGSPGNNNRPDTLKYSFSIIDMLLNGGLGDVLIKNTPIKSFATDKMTAIPHANGSDIWWVCRDWTDKFFSYKISCTGIDLNNPVVSSVGNNINLDQNLLWGDIKASSDGKYIAACYRNYFEIYRFDNSTGVISNPIKINGVECYGVEFSPDSKILYVTQVLQSLPFSPSIVAQYSISSYDSTSLQNSFHNVTQQTLQFGTSSTTGLQLGPNGKIYSAWAGPIIDVINNPNVLGAGCNFQHNVLPMPNPLSRRLPYAPAFLITSPNVQISNATVAADCRTVTFTAKTYIRGANLTFKWRFGDGDSTTQIVPAGTDTTFTTVTHVYPTNGIDTFFASLTVTSDTVCGVGSAGKTIVLKPPKPTANFGINTQCNSTQVLFTDSSLLNFNPALSYQWSFGNGQTSTLANNPPITFANFGSYTATLIVSSSLACVPADTLRKTFRLSTRPTANFTQNPAACTNQPTIFTSTTPINNTDSITQYFWLANGNSFSTQTNPQTTQVFTTAGSQVVRHWVRTINGCVSDTAFLPFTVQQAPAVSFTSTTACANQPTTFTSTSTVTQGAIAQLRWRLANGFTSTGPTLTTTFTALGTYPVTLLANTSNGCTDSSTQTITINPILANAGNDTTVFANTAFTLRGSGGLNYNWQPATFLNNANLAMPTATLTNSVVFTLTVTDAQQCSDTDVVAITVLPVLIPANLGIPNVFSPNGDGVNDVWQIANLASYAPVQVQIFNRYGQVVFSSSNYQNNFNGTYQGKPLPTGTYYYTLQIHNNPKPASTGSITIIR
ncbi:MAG: PKD domain-containing protein [Bacteroidetes bacterium]|nr:MAG: PKD domain-containing protein [Bacteroidota bacterium]